MGFIQKKKINDLSRKKGCLLYNFFTRKKNKITHKETTVIKKITNRFPEKQKRKGSSF